jgi:hypothetical protein
MVSRKMILPLSLSLCLQVNCNPRGDDLMMMMLA